MEYKTIKYNKLGIIALTGIIFSSMVGGGIFSIPQNIAKSANLTAGIIAWLITGFGIFCIANVFIKLSKLKPELDTGIYSYSEDGFGKFIGFLVGWSYLICNYLVSISLVVMSTSALNYFFPSYFVGGNNLLSIIVLSVIIWTFYFIVIKGFKFSANFNILATMLKFFILLFFIFSMIFVFDWNNFKSELFMSNDISLFKQISSSLLVTLWCFIGIETGSAISSEADSQKTVSNSIFLSFFLCLILYVLLSSLPYGFLNQNIIAKIPDPSVAGIMEIILGKKGSFIINIGVLVAILSCWFSWILILVELPLKMAEKNNFFKKFLKKNKNNISIYSSLLVSIITQIGIFIAFFSNNAWIMMQSLSGVMIIPAYLFSTLYLLKITKNKADIVFSIISIIFVFLIAISCNIGYIATDFILLTLSIPVFYLINKQNGKNEQIFNRREIIIVIFMVSISILAFISLLFGFIKIPELSL